MVPELSRDRARAACAARGSPARRDREAHAHRPALFRSRFAARAAAGSREQRGRARIPAREDRQVQAAARRIAEPPDRTRHPQPPRRRYRDRPVGQRHSRRVDQLQDRRRRLLGRARPRPARQRHGPAVGRLGAVRARVVAIRLRVHHQPGEPAVLAARARRAADRLGPDARATARARDGRRGRDQSQLQPDGA